MRLTTTEPHGFVSDAGPREVLGLIVKSRWLILAITTIVAVGVTAWTTRQPKVYEATCTIEYDPTPPRPLGNNVEDVAQPSSSYWVTREFYETQNRILKSRALAERVVERLQLHRDPDFIGVPTEGRASFTSVSIEQAALRVVGVVHVEPDLETRLVSIHVRDNVPERAQLIANTIADAYIEKTLEDRIGTSVSAFEWLSTQLDDIKRRLDTSEIALHTFKRENNILSVSMEDRQNIVANDIEFFSRTLTETQARRIQLTARLTQLRAQNADDPMQVDATSISENAAIETLRAHVREREAARDALAIRYGTAYPQIQALDVEIATAREQLRRAINGLIHAVDADLREVRQTEAGLRGALETANEAGLELNLREIEYERLNRERANNEKLYDLLLQRTTETNLTKLMRVATARVLDRALLPKSPVSPKVPLNIGVGVIVGFILSLVVALARRRLDRTVRAVEDAEAMGMTVLGVLPTIEEGGLAAVTRRKKKALPDTHRDLRVHYEPMSSAAECCRTIRTNLTFMSPDAPLRTLVVTSGEPREGKTTVAISIAITMAQNGKRVLLLDTDLRRPRVHKSFQLPTMLGVTSCLVGDATLNEAVQSTVVPGLDVLPCGPIPPNPAELLQTARFRELITEAAREYDRVILDSPPLTAVTDAAVIAHQVDGAVLVIRAHRTRRDAAASAMKQLADVGAKLVGAVMNDVDLNERSYGYGGYYRYRHGYYTNRDRDESKTAAAAE